MNEVEDFIYQFEGGQQEVLLYFHHLFLDLNLVSKIRYRVPFYYGKSWVCYLNPQKNGSIELVFIYGRKLSNTQGILNDKGRKQVSGIEFSNLDEIPQEAIFEIIQEALLIDET